mgnify:CR=1 FL=1
MSVINQMLLDLERRRASGEERGRIPDHVRALPGDNAHTRMNVPVLAAVLVLSLIVLAAGIWWWLAGRPLSPEPSVTPAALAVPVTAAPVAAAPAAAPLAAQDAVEMIARRMSFDLAHVPETISMAPAADAPVTTTSVITRRQPQPSATAVPVPAVTVAAKAGSPRMNPAVTEKKQLAAAAPAAAEIEKRVRQLTPRQRADAAYAKGAAALSQGLVDEARPAFEDALQIEPAYHPERQALVGVLLNARQPDEVSRLLQEGLQIAPAQYGFAMTLARLQMERGELDAATQTLSRSLEYAGTSADYIAFYAGLLQRQQKHAEAVVQFQRAFQLRNNVGVWLLGMGVSLEALGRRDDAQEAYRRAQASGNLSAELQAFAEQRLR